MKTRIIVLLLVSVMFILIAAQCTSPAKPTSAPYPPANTQPAAATLDGKVLLQGRCTVCHSLDRVTSRGGDATQWKTTVERMIKKGAQLNVDEETALVNYLVQAYP